MRPFIAAAVALSAFAFAAEAYACSCAFSCDSEIAVGDTVPANFKGVGAIYCDGLVPAAPAEAQFSLERKSSAGWEKVEAQEFPGDEPAYGPVSPWKEGERYRLTYFRVTKEFDVGPPLKFDSVEVGLKIEGPVVEEVAYSGSPACRRMVEATRYDVSLRLPAKFEPYRNLFIVEQLKYDEPWVHRTSNCSMDRPKRILDDEPFLVPVVCIDSPEAKNSKSIAESAPMSYKLALPGSNAKFSIAKTEPLEAHCAQDEPLADAGTKYISPDGGTSSTPPEPEPEPEPEVPNVPVIVGEAEGAESEDTSTFPMVLVGLGLFLIFAIVVGWKMSKEG